MGGKNQGKGLGQGLIDQRPYFLRVPWSFVSAGWPGCKNPRKQSRQSSTLCYFFLIHPTNMLKTTQSSQNNLFINFATLLYLPTKFTGPPPKKKMLMKTLEPHRVGSHRANATPVAEQRFPPWLAAWAVEWGSSAAQLLVALVAPLVFWWS